MKRQKRKRLGECFLPEAFEKEALAKEKVKNEVNQAFDQVNRIDLASVVDAEVDLSETQVLTLVSSKITFIGLMRLKLVSTHVPAAYTMIPKDSTVPFRFVFISDIMKEEGFTLSPSECKSYVNILENYCPEFMKSPHDLTSSLWKLTGKGSHKYNRFISPPVNQCLSCGKVLSMHDRPTQAIIYGMCGPLPASKVILECRVCRIKYGISQYSDDRGSHFYDESLCSDLVEVSNVTYMEKGLYRWIPSLGNHCWVSFSGFAEVYNEVYQNEIERFRGHVPDKVLCDTETPAEVLSTDKSARGNLFGEISYKTVAQSYWKKELEEEMDEMGIRSRWVFSSESSIDQGSENQAMEYIEKLRCESLYSHVCSTGCEKKGCGSLYVADGNWKLKYSHCMWKAPIKIDGFSKPINYPNICPLSPERGKAFCENHCARAQKAGIPSGLHEFLIHCGIEKGETCRETESDLSTDKKLEKVFTTLPQDQECSTDATTFQGTTQFIKDNVEFVEQCSEIEETTCNKDTGGRKTLQSWSRGVFFIVSGGGHIEYWQPLYRSESPTQAFLVSILWLYRKFKPYLDAGEPTEDVIKRMNNTILAYDNMCHLDGMKVAKADLPFPYPLSKVWLSIVKVIDRLHIRNHKDKKCKTEYNPEGKIPQEYNSMAAEQTFIWASRLKRIVCAMPRHHQFFYLHRAVKRRNRYTERCYMNGKAPLLPRKTTEWVEK